MTQIDQLENLKMKIFTLASVCSDINCIRCKDFKETLEAYIHEYNKERCEL